MQKITEINYQDVINQDEMTNIHFTWIDLSWVDLGGKKINDCTLKSVTSLIVNLEVHPWII